jgi:hypothetical protein
MKHGRVLIIGSETPWVEACVLEAGARKIVTVEYREIISEDPRRHTINFPKINIIKIIFIYL